VDAARRVRSTWLPEPLTVAAVAVVVVLAVSASSPSVSLSFALPLSLRSPVLVLLRDSLEGLFASGLRAWDCSVAEAWLRVPLASSELEGRGNGREDGGVPRALGGEGDRVVLLRSTTPDELSVGGGCGCGCVCGCGLACGCGCAASAGAADFMVAQIPVILAVCPAHQHTCEPGHNVRHRWSAVQPRVQWSRSRNPIGTDRCAGTEQHWNGFRRLEGSDCRRRPTTETLPFSEALV
jgi:hypothetical protein